MSLNEYFFSDNLFSYNKLRTKAVEIGDLTLGGDNPILVQSMTTTDTMDTNGTVEQILRLADVGCDIVRITAPNITAAENLRNIKKGLKKNGCQVPLIADIHFTPRAAEIAAKIVEKVRINPGNYADRKQFKTIEYTDLSYEQELERIRDRFTPLVKICKEHGTAMRIGSNHGSLSDRVLSRYGDTPLGMVESALEFLRICQDWDYHQIILSMKASNPTVMVHAYRLLVMRMKEMGHVYPLHLGVTEAGEGEDGRIKSALGIGTLLSDGIGDTIRVSLTEDPEFEIPVARGIVDYLSNHKQGSSTSINSMGSLNEKSKEYNQFFPSYEIKKRKTKNVSDFGGENLPRVILDYSDTGIYENNFNEMGFEKIVGIDKWRRNDISVDALYLGDKDVPAFLPPELKVIVDSKNWQKGSANTYPFFPSLNAFRSQSSKSSHLNALQIYPKDIDTSLKQAIVDYPVLLIIKPNAEDTPFFSYRKAALACEYYDIENPLVWRHSGENGSLERVSSEVSYQIGISCNLGSVLIDGFTQGVWLDKSDYALNAAFGLYQALRLRISRTEYISCPSCGRTLFDLQEVTTKIRGKTEHLKGVKIGIMGCVVNGPGEMADADFGYVGTSPGKISLYKGQEVMERNVDENVAVDRLIALIKKYDMWVEPLK